MGLAPHPPPPVSFQYECPGQEKFQACQMLIPSKIVVYKDIQETNTNTNNNCQNVQNP